jgi:hypothetical protein
MRRMLLVWTLLCGLAPLQSLAQTPPGTYDYPFTDPLVATILGTPDDQRAPLVRDIPVKLLDMTILPQRKVPDVFWYNAKLRSALAYQKGKAPLIFVIAGTGAGFNSDKMLGLQNAFYQAGFHVVTLSSPSHANFITAASETGTPGILRNDARDLYRVMGKIWEEIKDRIEVSDFYLTGYSLGGTQAAFVSMLDDERQHFNFRKVLMINPAVNLYQSVDRLDHMLDDNMPGGLPQIQQDLRRMLDRFAKIYAHGDFVKFDNEFLYDVYRALPAPPKEENLEALIGLTFRVTSSNMIFASDVMTQAGFVVPKGLELRNSDPLDEYLQTLSYISFVKYIDEFLLPATQAGDPAVTHQSLIEGSSLQSIAPYLSRTDKIAVMTNADDVILSPEDIDYLRQQFGPRATIFPHGGHCGNINQRQVVATMTDYFTRP